MMRLSFKIWKDFSCLIKGWTIYCIYEMRLRRQTGCVGMISAFIRQVSCWCFRKRKRGGCGGSGRSITG